MAKVFLRVQPPTSIFQPYKRRCSHLSPTPTLSSSHVAAGPGGQLFWRPAWTKTSIIPALMNLARLHSAHLAKGLTRPHSLAKATTSPQVAASCCFPAACGPRPTASLQALTCLSRTILPLCLFRYSRRGACFTCFYAIARLSKHPSRSTRPSFNF